VTEVTIPLRNIVTGHPGLKRPIDNGEEPILVESNGCSWMFELAEREGLSTD
jgi:hypothetical protein